MIGSRRPRIFPRDILGGAPLNCTFEQLPVLLSLAAALLFAAGIQFAKLGLNHTDSQTAALTQIGAATMIYWVSAPFFVKAEYWLSPAIFLLAAIGLFRPFLSANLSLAGTRLLGPTISSTLSSTAPLFGVSLGYLVLGEELTLPIVLGAGAVVAGVACLSWKGDVQRTWPVWALALPVGAALLRTLAQMFAKIGMEDIPSPFFVGLIGYSVSFAIAVTSTWGRTRRTPIPLWTPGSKWLVGTGLCYGLAILSLNTALLCGDLVVVSPIVACAPLFSLLLGWLVFRERTINRRVVIAVALVVPGVVLIAANA
ncbi:MAG: EamA family transporter [Gammaproteobacteria bacterium]|nr:EamA family transporter [Gammaproteobacteria bacterium]